MLCDIAVYTFMEAFGDIIFSMLLLDLCDLIFQDNFFLTFPNRYEFIMDDTFYALRQVQTRCLQTMSNMIYHP